MHFSFVTYSFDEVPRKVIRWLRVDERLVSKQRQLTKVQVWLPGWLCGTVAEHYGALIVTLWTCYGTL